MTKNEKFVLARILITAALFVPLFVLEHTDRMPVFGSPFLPVLVYAVPYLIIGYDIILRAVSGIRRAQAFDENFLMVIATVAAFCVQEYEEAVAVMLFFQVGQLFESYAVGRSRRSVSELMDICPDYANIENSGVLERVDPSDIEIGSIIVVRPGEKIPIDGVVAEGSSYLDTAALTGESVPRSVRAGDAVFSGCVNGAGTLKIETTKAFEDSTASRILELVEDAGARKAKLESFITRFARVYTPAVTLSAAALALVPPLLFGGSWSDWLHRACILLVVSCPCALVISVPLGFFGGIGAASKIGVLVKGGCWLEAVSRMKSIVFDKTGTLTKGVFTVTDIRPAGSFSKEALLEAAAHAEAYSSHPIAAAIRDAYGRSPAAERISDSRETAGCGVEAAVDGLPVLAGNDRLLKDRGIQFGETAGEGTVVYVAVSGTYAGALTISDTLKEGAAEAIAAVRSLGVQKCIMLTGDRRAAAEGIGRKLGFDAVHAELLPADKVGIVEREITNQRGGGKTAFVGDGLNDAPVLTRADIGIAMGSLGSDAAIEAADVVIIDDDIRKIGALMRISRKTMGIVRGNVVFAIGVKALVLVLGAAGLANMWAAVFADVGVAVLAILNSMRTLQTKQGQGAAAACGHALSSRE